MIDIVLGPNAKTPTKGSAGAAGYDLYNAEPEAFTLYPGQRHLFTRPIGKAHEFIRGMKARRDT